MFKLPPPAGPQRPLSATQVPGPIAPFDPRLSPEFRPPLLAAVPQMPTMQAQSAPGFTFAAGANMLNRALDDLQKRGGAIANAQPATIHPGFRPGVSNRFVDAITIDPASVASTLGPRKGALVVPDFLTGGWQPKGGFSA